MNSTTPNGKKPNILVISARGCGRSFGCYGAKSVCTPSVDALASEGALFENFFGVSSDSSPNQGAFFTGRQPQRNGLMGQCEEPWNWEMNDGENHFAQLLRLDNYFSVLFRLQDETALSNWKRLGFDEYRAKDLNPAVENPDPQKAWTAQRVAREVTAFFNERTKKPGPQRPFYAQVGFYEVRRPFDYGLAKRDTENGVDVPPRIKDGPEAKSLVAAFQGAIREVDKAVETILAGLKRHGLEESTLVVFTSSCGPDLVRDKGTLYDPGIALPLIMRLPGRIAPGTRISDLTCSVDFLPTVLELIESDMPFNIDGRSHLAELGGSVSKQQRENVFGIHTDSRYIRTKNFKLIVNLSPAMRNLAPPVDVSKAQEQEPAPVFELYKLDEDPVEANNLHQSPAYAQTLQILRTRLAEWMKKTEDPILKKVYPSDYFRKAIAALMAK